MDNFQISVVSNCRNTKLTITTNSELLKKGVISCTVSTKSGHFSTDFTYKSVQFNSFESVVKFAERVVKANEEKRFWLTVVENLQKRLKSYHDEAYNTFDYFEYQAKEFGKDETFESYFNKNKGRFFESSRNSISITQITTWIIQILSGISR